MIMLEQFGNLRDGDRYYYEIDEGLTGDEINEIKNTRLVDIINRNTNVAFMQDNVFLAQIHTAVTDIIADPLEMSVYPNPASGNFFINVTDVAQGEAHLQVSDLLGRTMMQKKIMLTEGITNFEVDLPDGIETGIYTLTLAANNRTGTTKIIVN
jgi:hypothetical protein